jgi:hypothetical protein
MSAVILIAVTYLCDNVRRINMAVRYIFLLSFQINKRFYRYP